MNHKSTLVEMVEKYQEGVLVSRKINGREVPITEMERNFIQLNKVNFEKVKSIFGKYRQQDK